MSYETNCSIFKCKYFDPRTHKCDLCNMTMFHDTFTYRYLYKELNECVFLKKFLLLQKVTK